MSSLSPDVAAALPLIPTIGVPSPIDIRSLINADALLLPRIELPIESNPPRAPPVLPDSRYPSLNPALFLNNTRPTARDDAMGFGPALPNVAKQAVGVRCLDNPVCTKPSHDTGYMRINAFRQANTCRGCVQEAVASIPSHATHMQTVRFVTALFRNYFCPFCLLEENDKGRMHLVAVKKHCKRHRIINRSIHCKHGDQLWQNCTRCTFDPRAATAVCACGNLLREKKFCTCDPSLKALSYGIRFNVNPFKVPTAAEQAQDAEWVRFNIEEATSMRLRAAELEGQLAPKRVRKAAAPRAPFVKPRLP